MPRGREEAIGTLWGVLICVATLWCSGGWWWLSPRSAVQAVSVRLADVQHVEMEAALGGYRSALGDLSNGTPHLELWVNSPLCFHSTLLTGGSQGRLAQ